MTKWGRQPSNFSSYMLYFITILLCQEYLSLSLPPFKTKTTFAVTNKSFSALKKIGVLAASPIEREKKGVVFTCLLTAFSDAFNKSVVRYITYFFRYE